MKSALAFWPVIFVCFLICPWSVITTPFKKTMTVQGTDDSFDWRNKGVISNVSDQGMMGDPMDYVITEGVESLLAIQTGLPVIELSIDEVGECCDDEGHQPKYQGFDCIVLIGGLCKVDDYNSTEGICNNATCQAVGKVTRTGYLPANREDVMLQVIHQVPLSALIDAELTSFQTYTTGIYDDPNCSSEDLDHVVQIVGYGTRSDVDYWIIKNSWGVDWGEHGYMRIARGKNQCGIASYVFYPINDKPVYPINDKPVYAINDKPVYPINDKSVYPINDKPVYPINDKPACYP